MCIFPRSHVIPTFSLNQRLQAALDHYFYHDNTAPFIAFRLIQRFTTSNPTPSYVNSVAMAFRSGSYDGIGEG